MNAEVAKIRILTVDDHPIVRQGIAGLVGIQPDMMMVAEASNGRDAIQQYRLHHPDLTLMDLQMPEMNGLDALIAIRNESPAARIIVLTTYAGGCSDFSRTQSRRASLPAQEYVAHRLIADHPRCAFRQERSFSRGLLSDRRACR